MHDARPAEDLDPDGDTAPRPLRVLTVARWYPAHDLPGSGTFVADLLAATAPWCEHRVASFDRLVVRGPLHRRGATAAAARAALDATLDPAALFSVPGPGFAASAAAAGVPVARLPLVRLSADTNPDRLVEDHAAALRPFLARLIGTWRPDVLHAHTGLPDGAAAVLVGRELGIPVVVSEHMSTLAAALADPAARARYAMLLEPPTRLVAVSPHLAATAAAALGVDPARIEVTPNPVDGGRFPLAPVQGRDADELLWVGKLATSKGMDVLLRAFATLRTRRPSLRLRLLGAPEHAVADATLRALVSELALGDGVTFEGWQPREAVAAAMARAAVLVHASPYETFGVAAAEAILTGLPVAARRSGGVPWVIEMSGGFGEVAEGDDSDAFVRAVERVLDRREDPKGGLDATAAAAARERLLASVGPAAVAAAWMGRYEEVTGRRTTRIARTGPAGRVAQGEHNGTTDLPLVLAGASREEALTLVGRLPASVRAHVTLLTVPGPESPAPGAAPARIIDVRIPAIAGSGPSGTGLAARVLRRTLRASGLDRRTEGIELAAWRQAIVDVVEAHGAGNRTVVPIDATAAVAVAGLADRGVRLAPGGLRWLADRARGTPPPG